MVRFQELPQIITLDRSFHCASARAGGISRHQRTRPKDHLDTCLALGSVWNADRTADYHHVDPFLSRVQLRIATRRGSGG